MGMWIIFPILIIMGFIVAVIYDFKDWLEFGEFRKNLSIRDQFDIFGNSLFSLAVILIFFFFFSLSLEAQSLTTDDAGLTWDEAFYKNRDNLKEITCSGETVTRMGAEKSIPQLEYGNYTNYFYFNDDYLFRLQNGRLDGLGFSSVIYGWKPIKHHSDVWIDKNEIIFNVDYPKEYLDDNPLDNLDVNRLELLTEKHTTTISRVNGDYSYTYYITLKDKETGEILYREDVWSGTCVSENGLSNF